MRFGAFINNTFVIKDLALINRKRHTQFRGNNRGRYKELSLKESLQALYSNPKFKEDMQKYTGENRNNITITLRGCQKMNNLHQNSDIQQR